MKVRMFNYGDYESGNYGSSRGISLGKLDLYFSYDTVVAFTTPEDGLIVCENNWGPTTGKHLNWIQPDKKLRYKREKFLEKLDKVLKKHKLEV